MMNDSEPLNKIFEKYQMTREDQQTLLQKLVANNSLEIAEAQLDLERESRCGFPEVILGEFKDLQSLTAIVTALTEKDHPILITRLQADKAKKIIEQFNDLEYQERSQCLHSIFPTTKKKETVQILCAGTSDLAVAEEALYTLRFLGINVELTTDVGVAGIHRLIKKVSSFEKAECLIVIAGMEGALPSVVGGLTRLPIIAVPTSVGYGTAHQGETALNAMLSSCASGISVVNIDNGFGAACAAARIINQIQS